MAFSDSIDADMLLTGIRFMRESTAQNASGDYVTAATTIAHTVKGDIQPMQPGFTSYMARTSIRFGTAGTSRRILNSTWRGSGSEGNAVR